MMNSIWGIVTFQYENEISTSEKGSEITSCDSLPLYKELRPEVQFWLVSEVYSVKDVDT